MLLCFVGPRVLPLLCNTLPKVLKSAQMDPKLLQVFRTLGFMQLWMLKMHQQRGGRLDWLSCVFMAGCQCSKLLFEEGGIKRLGVRMFKTQSRVYEDCPGSRGCRTTWHVQCSELELELWVIGSSQVGMGQN